MPDYIIEPLDTDPESIFQQFVDFVQQYYPEWDPSEGQLDVVIARFFSMQSAFTADMASRVQRAIYRYFGSSLANIQPIIGSAAGATIRFYCQDNDLTNILQFGSFVGLHDLNGDRYLFMTLADMVVEPHGLTGTVEAQATELGIAANNLTGAVELAEMVDWIDSAEVDGISSGGSDPEQDPVYIERLTVNLSLMAPRPIIAADFALISQNVPGVWRAAALDNFAPGTNEKQTITSNRTAGTWTAQFAGSAVSSALNFNATAAQIKTALAALSTIDDRDIIATGGPLGTAPVVIEFTGQWAMRDVPLIVANVGGLSGGSSFTLTQTTASVMWTPTAANTVAVSAVDEAGNRVSDAIRDDMMEYLQSLRQQNFVIHYIEPSYNLVAVNYAGVSLPAALASSVQSNVNDALTAYLSPNTWGIPAINRQTTRAWEVPVDPTKNKMRYLDLTTVVENVLGYDYTTALTFSVAGGTMDATDKLLQGAFPLAQIAGTPGGTGVAQG